MVIVVICSLIRKECTVVQVPRYETMELMLSFFVIIDICYGFDIAEV